MQEVNDFLQALFGFVLTGNIGKFDGLAILNDILFGTGFAAAKNHAVGAAGHFTDPLAHHAVEPDDQDDHGQQRDDPAQQVSTQVVWLYTLPKETPALSNRLTSCRSCAMELVQ